MLVKTQVCVFAERLLKMGSREVNIVTVKNDFLEPQGLWVSVDEVVYQPQAHTPPDRPHCFAYHITIHNDTDATVAIKGRKWVVRGNAGDIVAVEGDGVVGQFPTIEPGEHFSYHSFHLLAGKSAVAEGSYLGVDAEGRKVLTRIPKFKMDVPSTEIGWA